MDISGLITPETIFMDLDIKNKEECIGKMADGLVKAGFVDDKAVYTEALAVREKTGPTGVGFGVAIPHGKSEGVAASGLAFAKLKNPIEWPSLDGKPVSIIFMIAVPKKDTQNEHLKILIAISKKLIYEEFRNRLTEASTSEDVLMLLQSI